jgi:uridine kinase
MKPLIVGIAGGSGAGKTTFLRALMNHFEPHEVALVSQDNYYKPKELQQADENGVINFDLPSSIDHDHFVRDMEDLAAGKTITKLEYNFNNPAWKPESIEVHPAPIIVMEGLFVFHFSEIKSRLNYKVYLDAHVDLRLNRRIKRDMNQRGYPEHEVRYQWDNHVRPAELQFLEPHRHSCELIVDNSHSYDDGLQTLVETLQTHLSQH